MQGGDDDRAPGVEATTQTPSRRPSSSSTNHDHDHLCSKCQEPLDDSVMMKSEMIKDEPREESFNSVRGVSDIREAIKMAKSGGKMMEESMNLMDSDSDDNMEDSLAMDLPRHFLSVSPRAESGSCQVEFNYYINQLDN